MTTTVTVQSHNTPARVQTLDNGEVTDERTLVPADGVVTFHATTTREIRVLDVEAEASAD